MLRILLVLLLAVAAPAHATVTTLDTQISYTGTGAQTSFPIPYGFVAPTDILLIVNGVAKTYTTDYTVVKSSGVPGGTLTTVVAPASGATVVIRRATPKTQPVHYSPTAPVPPATQEGALDRLTFITQEVGTGVIAATCGVGQAVTGIDANGVVTCSAVSGGSGISGLTSPRVPYATSATTLGDSADLTWNNSLSALTVKNLYAKNSPWIDVRAYGATGDGTTDDTAAMQTAINAGQTANVPVFWPCGTYKVTSTLTSDATKGNGIVWLGSGPCSVIKATTGILMMQVNAGSTNVIAGYYNHVEGLTFASTHSGSVGLEMQGTGSSFHSYGRYLNLRFHGGGLGINVAKTSAASDTGFDWNLIQDIECGANQGLLNLTGCIRFSNGSGTGNVLANGNVVINGGIGIDYQGTKNVGDITIMGWQMATEGAGTGIKLASGASYKQNITITNSQFECSTPCTSINADGYGNLRVANISWGGNTTANLPNTGTSSIIQFADEGIVDVFGTGTNGANLKLHGDTGAGTPAKSIRAHGGKLEVLNNAYSTILFSLSDTGVATFSNLGGGGTQCVQVNNSGVLSGTGSACGAGGGGGGISSLGGQTGATQTFADVDDTNVTLAIASAADSHTFTMGWSGTLAASRGGFGADMSAASGVISFNSGARVVNNVLTAGRVLFGKATNEVNSDALFIWDNSNKRLGLNQASPAVLLDARGQAIIGQNTGTLPSSGGASLHLAAADASTTFAVLDSFGASVYSLLRLRHARGTAGSPSAVQANDALAIVGGVGYGATGYSAAEQTAIGFYANQNWTDANQGAFMVFTTTPDGSTSVSERMRIAAAGQVLVGTTTVKGWFTSSRSVSNPTTTDAMIGAAPSLSGDRAPGSSLNVEMIGTTAFKIAPSGLYVDIADASTTSGVFTSPTNDTRVSTAGVFARVTQTATSGGGGGPSAAGLFVMDSRQSGAVTGGIDSNGNSEHSALGAVVNTTVGGYGLYMLATRNSRVDGVEKSGDLTGIVMLLNNNAANVTGTLYGIDLANGGSTIGQDALLLKGSGGWTSFLRAKNTAGTDVFVLSGSGIVTTGQWQATIIQPTYGGTGVNNGAKTITLGGSLTTSGANSLTLTTTGATNVTLPTSGTLVTAPVPTAQGGLGGNFGSSSGVLTMNSGTVVANNVLTATRVLFAAASNTIASDAQFTYVTADDSLHLSRLVTTGLTAQGDGTINTTTYYADDIAGLTQTITVRDSAGTGTCTLIFRGGIKTGGTCS